MDLSLSHIERETMINNTFFYFYYYFFGTLAGL
jgi:hypothetical protein